jgi:hypothetical protein
VLKVVGNYMETSEISIPFNYPKGIYFVIVQSDFGTISTKILN